MAFKLLNFNFVVKDKQTQLIMLKMCQCATRTIHSTITVHSSFKCGTTVLVQMHLPMERLIFFHIVLNVIVQFVAKECFAIVWNCNTRKSSKVYICHSVEPNQLQSENWKLPVAYTCFHVYASERFFESYLKSIINRKKCVGHVSGQ